MILLDVIAQHIAEMTARHFEIAETRSIGGGCINQAMRISDGATSYFVKINQADRLDMFEAEADALAELAAVAAVRVPGPVCCGEAEGQSYLVLEYLNLSGRANMDVLGRQLAAMHRHTSAQYGWWRSNTIGATPQKNDQHPDWIHFWRQHRLGYQLQLAASQGYGGELQRLGAQLLERMPVLFDRYQPPASLLHGDLWGGNAAGLADGTPVMFDPALYYGDRETDLAMTELFGGFGGRFYAAYHETWPLDAGYATRKTFYNLYHILNHLNMFGGGYQGQAVDMLRRILAEI